MKLLWLMAAVSVWATGLFGDTIAPPAAQIHINHPPRIKDYSPKKLSSGERNEYFFFSVKAEDPDRDSLAYLWTLNGMELSRGPKTDFVFGSVGHFVLTALVSDGLAIDSVSWSVTVADKSSPVKTDSLAPGSPQIVSGTSSEDEIDNLIGGNDETSEILHDVLIKVMHMLHDSSGGLGGSQMPQIIDPSLILRIMPQSGSPPALNDSIIKPLIDSLNKK